MSAKIDALVKITHKIKKRINDAKDYIKEALKDTQDNVINQFPHRRMEDKVIKRIIELGAESVEDAMLYSQIDSRFREIAKTTPEIWGSGLNPTHMRRPELLRRFSLCRKKTPLHIDLSDSASVHFRKHFMHTIRKTTKEWRSLRVGSINREETKTLSGFDCPILSSITFTEGLDAATAMILQELELPKLKELTIQKGDFQWSSIDKHRLYGTCLMKFNLTYDPLCILKEPATLHRITKELRNFMSQSIATTLVDLSLVFRSTCQNRKFNNETDDCQRRKIYCGSLKSLYIETEDMIGLQRATAIVSSLTAVNLETYTAVLTDHYDCAQHNSKNSVLLRDVMPGPDTLLHVKRIMFHLTTRKDTVLYQMWKEDFPKLIQSSLNIENIQIQLHRNPYEDLYPWAPWETEQSRLNRKSLHIVDPPRNITILTHQLETKEIEDLVRIIAPSKIKLEVNEEETGKEICNALQDMKDTEAEKAVTVMREWRRLKEKKMQGWFRYDRKCFACIEMPGWLPYYDNECFACREIRRYVDSPLKVYKAITGVPRG